MEPYDNFLFLSSFEDNLYNSQRQKGDHLVVQVDPLFKEESVNGASDTDKPLANLIDEDCIQKFQHTIESNMRNGDILKEHLHKFSAFLLSLKNKIKEVEADHARVVKQMEVSQQENKDLQRVNRILQNELQSIKSTRLTNFSQYKFLINNQKLTNQELLNSFKGLMQKNREFRKTIKQKDALIKNKDKLIKSLESKINGSKDHIENEFKEYENKILELIKQFENEKMAKIKFYKTEYEEIKYKLEEKEKQILQMNEENISLKARIEELIIELKSLNKSFSEKSKILESVILMELKNNIYTLTTENSSLVKKNEFLNKSIRDLLFQIKDLQTQVKLIEPKQFLKMIPEAHLIPTRSISINDRSETKSSSLDSQLSGSVPELNQLSNSLSSKSSDVKSKFQNA